MHLQLYCLFFQKVKSKQRSHTDNRIKMSNNPFSNRMCLCVIPTTLSITDLRSKVHGFLGSRYNNHVTSISKGAGQSGGLRVTQQEHTGSLAEWNYYIKLHTSSVRIVHCTCEATLNIRSNIRSLYRHSHI